MPARILSFLSGCDVLSPSHRKWTWALALLSPRWSPTWKAIFRNQPVLTWPRSSTAARCYRCLADELRGKPLRFPLSFYNPTVWFLNHCFHSSSWMKVNVNSSQSETALQFLPFTEICQVDILFSSFWDPFHILARACCASDVMSCGVSHGRMENLPRGQFPCEMQYLVRFGQGLSRAASGKPEKEKKLYFCSFRTSYLWYNFLMSLLAILEAKGLFVLLWTFSRPQDNGFKKRNGKWWNRNNAIILSRRKLPGYFNWVV